MEQLLDDFERSLVRQQRSPETLRSYRWALQDLVRFCQGRGVVDISQFHRVLLEDWQDSLIARHLAPGSRLLAASSSRAFLRWCAVQGLCRPELEHAIAHIRKPRSLPRPIAPHDLELIRAYLLPRRPRMSLVALRDRALFFYLLASGARISEALQVTREEVSRALIWQKGGSRKVLRIPPAAEAMVRDYLDSRSDDCPWLWVTHDSNRPLRRLAPAGAREIWKRLAKHLGVPPWTTHQLRHTCASELLEAGVPEIVVAAHLGHSGLGTLHVYGEVREAQRQLALDAAQELVGEQHRPRLLPRIRKGRY